MGHNIKETELFYFLSLISLINVSNSIKITHQIPIIICILNMLGILITCQIGEFVE